MSSTKDLALQYARNGFSIFPCSGKSPVRGADQKFATTDKDQIEKWWSVKSHNIGINTGRSGLTVIDVDTKEDPEVGLASFEALVEECGGFPETRMVRTGSGGTHYYFITPDGAKIPSRNHFRKNLDIKSSGDQYVIAAGSTHPETGKLYEWVNPTVKIATLTDRMVEVLSASSRKPVIKDVDYSEDAMTESEKEKLQKTDKTDLKKLVKALKRIPADCGYDKWFRCCDALKFEMREQGWPFFLDWSKGGRTYRDESDARKMWDSCAAGGDHQAATIYFLANEYKEEQVQEIVRAIDKEWVYVAALDRFVNRARPSQVYTVSVLHSMFRHQLPKEERRSVGAILLDDPSFTRLEEITYRPGRGVVVEEDGVQKFNIWTDPKVPAVKGDYSILTRHVARLFPKKEMQDILLDFLAFQVQRPDEKMTWCIYLQGGQGTGKSWFKRLMAAIIGQDNVYSLSTYALERPFNRWISNHRLIVMDEARGSDVFDVTHKLQDLITERWLTVEEKGLPAYGARCCANFLIISNDKDAVRLRADDRRYCAMFSELEREDGDVPYYDQLNEALDKKEFIAACHFYLLNRDISGRSFNGVAPMTDSKAELIESGYSPLEQFIKELHRAQEYPMNVEMIGGNELLEALIGMDEFGRRGLRPPTPNSLGHAMGKMGFPSVKVRLKSKDNFNNNSQRYDLKRIYALHNIEKFKKTPQEEIGNAYLRLIHGVKSGDIGDDTATDELFFDAKKAKPDRPM